jgi:hypothetical protein
VRITRPHSLIALAAGQAALSVAAVLLPWSGNALGGASSRAEVLAGLPAAIGVVLWLAAAAAVVLEVPSAVRGGWRAAGVACSLGAVLAVVSVLVSVYGSTVRAYQVDSVGNVGEPEAASHPGPGLWCALALCLFALAVHAVPLLRTRRS